MRSIKTILLILAAMSFIIIIGGGTYEHVTSVPRWKLAPPESLTMFQGKYGIDTGSFWKNIHPLTMLLFIAALIANWKTERRKYILIPLVGYGLILVITFAFFVPELISITHTTYQPVVDEGLVARAALWEKLSLIRMVCMMGMAGGLLFSLTRGNEHKKA